MALFGIGDSPLHSNQIHILFAPVMAAYGLAFLSILWARITLPHDFPLASTLHFIAITLLSAGPLLINLPQDIKFALFREGAARYTLPFAINHSIAGWTKENEIVVSDQPWAVAWYADRKSLWLPYSQEHFEQIEALASDRGTPFAGILLTPYSTSKTTMESYFSYPEHAPLILEGWARMATKSNFPKPLSASSAKLRPLLARYHNVQLVFDHLIIYHSAKPLKAN